jgi:hypothetical protein
LARQLQPWKAIKFGGPSLPLTADKKKSRERVRPCDSPSATGRRERGLAPFTTWTLVRHGQFRYCRRLACGENGLSSASRLLNIGAAAWVISSCPSCIPKAWGRQDDISISTLLKHDIFFSAISKTRLRLFKQ